MIKAIVATSLFMSFLATSAVSANERFIVSGTIKFYRIAEYESGVKTLLVSFEDEASVRGPRPACSNSDTIFNLSLNSGIADQVMSIVMTAHISRLKVTAYSPLSSEASQCLGNKSRLAMLTVNQL